MLRRERGRQARDGGTRRHAWSVSPSAREPVCQTLPVRCHQMPGLTCAPARPRPDAHAALGRDGWQNRREVPDLVAVRACERPLHRLVKCVEWREEDGPGVPALDDAEKAKADSVERMHALVRRARVGVDWGDVAISCVI